MKLPTRRGSTRIITSFEVKEGGEDERGLLKFVYDGDWWSAFDRGTSSQPIPGIDFARVACAVRSFKYAHELGIRTHFVRQTSRRGFVGYEYAIDGLEPLTGKVHGRVLPLEVIWHIEADGSLLTRLKSGKISRREVGLDENVALVEGVRLPFNYIEATTKLLPVDVHLTVEKAQELARISQKQWADIQVLVRKLVNYINRIFRDLGFTVRDGKFELALTPEGEIVFVDVFFTPDENRIVDERGEHHDKEVLRQYLNTKKRWKLQLLRAKAEHPDNKDKWPPYPHIAKRMVALMSGRYTKVALLYAPEEMAFAA